MKDNIKTENIRGAKVGIYQLEALQAAFIEFRFKAGSIYESYEHWGTLHLLEHMLFTRSRNFNNDQALEIYKEEYGMINNGWTGPLDMGFWFKFPYSNLEKAIYLFEDMIFYPIFTDKILAREKNIIEQEYRDKYSSPYQRFHRKTVEQLYGSVHPYMRDGIGKPDHLKEVSVSDLKKLHEKFIVPANMFVGYAGKNSNSSVVNQLKNTLSSLSKGTEQVAAIPQIQPETSYYWHKEDVDHVEIVLNWQMPGHNTLSIEDICRINIASYLIGGSPRSKLYQRLRHELGLVYSTGASFNWWDEISYFQIWASTSAKNAKKVYTELNKIVQEYINTPTDNEVYERSRKFMDTQTLLKYDSVSSSAQSMAGSLITHGRVISADEYIEMSKSFKESELRDLLKLGITEEKSPFISVLSSKDPKLNTLAS